MFLLLLAGFASQGGRATVTYKPRLLKGDGQGCPSDENIAQAIEDSLKKELRQKAHQRQASNGAQNSSGHTEPRSC